MTIIPAILSDQPAVIAQQLAAAGEYEALSRVQIDIIDGLYADNITITPADFWQFDFGDLQVDIHLMTQEPLDFVHELIEHKAAAQIKTVIAQVERMSSQEHFLAEVRAHGWEPGLSLDLHTPLEAIDPDSWQHLRALQIMGIRAGFQGQVFHPSTLGVLEQARVVIDRHSKGVPIELLVDGGVKPELLLALQNSGVDAYTVGSGLWTAASIEEALDSYGVE